MHRPRQIVGHDDGAVVSRMVSIASHKLEQELRKSLLPQVYAVGQTPSRGQDMQRDLGHCIAQMPVAQSKHPQIWALRNRDSDRGRCFGLGRGHRRSSSHSVRVRTRTSGAISDNSLCSSAPIKGSGYTITGAESSSPGGNAANVINSGRPGREQDARRICKILPDSAKPQPSAEDLI